MVDLDSDPTKLIELVAIDEQLLMTRGAYRFFDRQRCREMRRDPAAALWSAPLFLGSARST